MDTIIQISQVISAIIIIIGALTGIITFCTKKGQAWIKKHIFEPIQNPIYIKLEDLDLNQCRNYLVEFIADMENGVPKNEVQKQRAYEIYDRYSKLGGNSYIHSGFDKLKERGLI